VKLCHFQHPHQFLIRKSGPNLLKVRETQAIGLEVRLSKTSMSRERFRKLLQVGRLVLAVVETERAEIVMEQTAERGEDLPREGMKKPRARSGKNPFETGQERLLDHVNVDHTASQVTPEKGRCLQ